MAKKEKKGISLTNQILIASAIGLIAGAIIGPGLAPIGVLGEIFLNLIMMSVPILILGAIAEAVGQLTPADLGKLGVKIFGLFMVTTAIAAVFGLLFGFLFQPGAAVDLAAPGEEIAGHGQSFTDILVGFFPDNIVDALAEANMMQIIVFALLLGVATSSYVDRTGDDRLLKLIKTTNDTVLTIIGYIMKIAPIGVGALLAEVAATTGLSVLQPLAMYLLTLLVAVIFIMIAYYLLAGLYLKVSPIVLLKKTWPMTVMAFTTTSSAMSLPIKMKDSEEKLGVSPRISNLVNPLGMVLNSAGQTTFLSIASLFIIQLFNIEITFIALLQIVILSTLVSMGTLAVPGGALVIFASMMPTLGLPIQGVAYIAGVDWFRGAFSTIPNVTGDALISTVIAKMEGEFDRDIFDGKKVHIQQKQTKDEETETKEKADAENKVESEAATEN